MTYAEVKASNYAGKPIMWCGNCGDFFTTGYDPKGMVSCGHCGSDDTILAKKVKRELKK